MITPASIDKLKEVINITQVVESCGIEFKKGRNKVTCCPFHSEKTGSFSVDDSKGFYKCFGCGASGDAIKFVQDYKNLAFHEAIEWLADLFRVQLEYTNDTQAHKEERSEKEQAYVLMGKAKTIYHKLLMGNAEALSYLWERGLTQESVIAWELGYAPASWRTMSDLAVQSGKWDLAVKCGLCKENGDKNHDIFFDRIMFPIHNEQGKCISFGSRIWRKEQEDKKEPKYINGPNTFIYSKESSLYGIHKTNEFIKKEDEAILVEGYLDVISAYQHELKNITASSGTAVTESHAKQLLKKTKNILLAGDNDEAGQKSIMTAIDLFYQSGAVKVDVVVWPEGVKDIDQYLKQNSDEQ